MPKGQLMKSPSRPLAGWFCGQAGEESFTPARADVTPGKQSARGWGGVGWGRVGWGGPFLSMVPGPALLVLGKGWGRGGEVEQDLLPDG